MTMAKGFRSKGLAKGIFPVKCRKYAENGELWLSFKKGDLVTHQEKSQAF